MPDVHFSFIAALWGLPLVGLPVLLHLLFQRKSPVLLFSTVRLIKASIERTAARRRVQRWLLLACRSLLLLLLILTAAQPAKILPALGSGGRHSAIAAVIVIPATPCSFRINRARCWRGRTAWFRSCCAARSRMPRWRSSPASPRRRAVTEALRPAGELLGPAVAIASAARSRAAGASR